MNLNREEPTTEELEAFEELSTSLDGLARLITHYLNLGLRHGVIAGSTTEGDTLWLATEFKDGQRLLDGLMERLFQLHEAEVLDRFATEIFSEATKVTESGDYHLGKYATLRSVSSLARARAEEARQQETE